MKTSKRRVLVFGLDAAEWTLVDQLVRAGDLPHLARLRERGVTCRLRQEIPLTEQPWAAFLSGAPVPETSLRFDPQTYDAFEIGAPRTPPFYAQPGLHAVVVDVPRMTLAYPVDGAQITGWGGHHLGYPRASLPVGLLTQIDDEVGRHPVFAGFGELRWYEGGELRRFIDQMILGVQRRVDVLRWLGRRVPEWDVMVTVSPEAHTVGQILWYALEPGHPLAGYRDRDTAHQHIRAVYRALDSAVGRLVAAFGDEATFVICSVHGIKPNDHDVLSALLPELLARVFVQQQLFAVPDPGPWKRSGCPPVVPGVSSYASNFGAPRSMARRVRGHFGYYARRYVPGIADAVRRFQNGQPAHYCETDQTPDAVGENPTPHGRHVANRYRQFWPRMKAFALPTYTLGRVRVNMRGRERDGIVPPEMYERVCDEVESIVRACRNPRTGEEVVHDIWRVRPDDRNTPERSYADLTIVWKGCADALEHPDAGVIGPLAYDRTGSHSTRGFAVIAGPGISHADLGERPALDLTPSILALLGRESAMCVGRSFM